VNRTGVLALECTYRLIISLRGRCEQAHCHFAESITSPSIVPALSSSLVLGALTGPPSSISD
jgi:hypothetical protein